MAGNRVKKWLRIIIPASLILVWLTLASIGGPYFGKIDEVSSNNQSTFLPDSAESTKAQELQSQYRESSYLPAIIVLERPDGLATNDFAFAGQLPQKLQQIEGMTAQISPPIPSQDKKAIQIVAGLELKADLNETVEEMRKTLANSAPSGLQAYVAGPAGSLADLTDAFGGIDSLLLGVALAVVFVILLIVYRSPLLPFLVLFTSMFALTVSVLIVWWLAKKGVVELNGQVQGILFILVIGAATDYSLLYVSRYREALRLHKRNLTATLHSLRHTVEPVVASAATIVAGLLCMLFSDLNSNQALGPVAAVGIAMSVLAALTFLPSLLLICGRTSYWPRRVTFEPEKAADIRSEKSIWPRIANLIDRRYRRIWAISLAVLCLMTIGLVQLNANGVEQNELILGESQARDGQTALAKHFPGGSGSPTIAIVQADQLSAAHNKLKDMPNVANISVAAKDAPGGSLPLTPNGQPVPIAGARPTMINNQVSLNITFKAASDSQVSEAAVTDIRRSLKEVDPNSLVGGPTATSLDVKETSLRDRNVIIPMVLGVITIILMLLLRAVIAPLVLLGTTVLSFAATMGLASVLFENVLHLPGSDPSVPLYGFIFLVALGIDYNIFLMTRVREETLQYGTRQGVLRGLAITGRVITSAGIVLAATFAALAVIPILFLLQIAFIVGFGVLLDAIVVRSLLVPALVRQIGPLSWWPSKLAKEPANRSKD